MWTSIQNSLDALINYSPMAFFIGIIIIVLSVVDAFLSKKSGKERVISVAVAILSVLLLIVQAKSSELANADSEMKLLSALQMQRDLLNGAFRDGTNQVIVATSETANQTRRSAKQQTNTIKQQAVNQFAQLQAVMLGTSMCPSVFAGVLAGGTAGQISVANQDPKLNLYDVRVQLTEFGPDQTSGHNEEWAKILQNQAIIFPLIAPGWASSAPVTFLSKMTDIHVEFSVITRTTKCGGSTDIYDTGKDGWQIDKTMMYQGSKLLSRSDKHLSPGLANSRLDSQSAQ
jgi:hypothetical protein